MEPGFPVAGDAPQEHLAPEASYLRACLALLVNTLSLGARVWTVPPGPPGGPLGHGTVHPAQLVIHPRTSNLSNLCRFRSASMLTD
jgi:hypothetical protein